MSGRERPIDWEKYDWVKNPRKLNPITGHKHEAPYSDAKGSGLRALRDPRKLVKR